MNPRDYAVEIEPGAPPERLFEIEKVIRRALAEEDYRLSNLIDDNYFERRILYCNQAAETCRNAAAEHLNHT